MRWLLLSCGLALGQELFVGQSRLDELLKLKQEIHLLSPKEASERINCLGSGQPRPHQDRIDHFVVVYMENHAFDHYFGCLNRPGMDGIPKEGMKIPKDPTNASAGFVNVSCGGAAYVCESGPGHDNYKSFFKPGEAYAKYPYGEQSLDWAFSNGAKEGVTVEMMGPEQLPIKSTLAENYGLFNKLFTSVPSESMPNHMFTQTGTSCGIHHNLWPYSKCGGKKIIDHLLYPQWTIYDQLHHDGVKFNIFFDSPDLPPDAYMTGVLRHLTHWRTMGQFHKQAKKGKLPQFSWLVPPNKGSDHPCHDIARGEAFHKEVYESVRNGAGWNKTLMVILYDDAGGYFDHIVPPSEGVPSDDAPCHVTEGCPDPFDFKRLGKRSAAVLVSPWVGKGAVFQGPQKGPFNTSQFDLTSVIATTRTLFNLSAPLTKRDEWAGSFEELLLDEMRTDDMPAQLPDAPPPAEVEDDDDDDDEDDAAHISLRIIEQEGAKFGKPSTVRRLQQGPTPQHCSASDGVCRGPDAVTVKQRRNIGILSHVTQRAHPDVESMDYAAASAWLREHLDLLSGEVAV